MIDFMLLLCLICYLTIFEDFRLLGFCHSPVNSLSWMSEQHGKCYCYFNTIVLE